MMKPPFLILMVLYLLSLPVSRSGAEEMRVYFIGNSLTASTTLDRVHDLVEQHGIDLEFGSQLSGGKSLIRHRDYKEEPDQKWKSWETNVEQGGDWLPDPNMHVDEEGETHRFGLYDEALRDHAWDKVVFQLYGGTLHDDLEAISTFIDLAEAKGGTDAYYIYSTWPTRPKQKLGDGTVHVDNIDYQAEWQMEYTASADDANWKTARLNYHTRSYVDRLYAALREKYPEIDLRLIPAGEVLFALDAKIKAGGLPGLGELAERSPEMVPGLAGGATMADGVNVLYADPVHLNPIPHQGDTVGILVSGTCVATGISGRSPVGLSADAYGMDPEKDADLVKALQETIWEVFTADPRTGVR